ncbi:MAG: hypothetical protein NZT61_01555 [Deltaproteobacteria bacterium]|nr:hypothetical protein [Deltaproteobacteria bacterium]
MFAVVYGQQNYEEINSLGLIKALELGERGVSYYDPKSIKKEGNKGFIDIYVYYNPPYKMNVSKSIQKYSFDCNTGDWRIEKMKDFKTDGNVMELPDWFLKQAPTQKNCAGCESDRYFSLACGKKT